MPELSVDINIKAATWTTTLFKLYSLVYLGMNITEASDASWMSKLGFPMIRDSLTNWSSTEVRWMKQDNDQSTGINQ